MIDLTQQYTLYGPHCLNVNRVIIFLHYKKIKVKRLGVDQSVSELIKNFNLAELNSSLRVPVLQGPGGLILTESVAICRYFAALYPEPNVFGKTAEAQAMIDVYSRMIEADLIMRGLLIMRQHGDVYPVSGRSVYAYAEAKKCVVATLSVFEEKLKNDGYLARESFSMVDILWATTMQWNELRGMYANLLAKDRFPHLFDVLQGLKNHAAVQNVPAISGE